VHIVQKKISLVCIAILVVLCVLVPYTVLSHVNAWYGSFLFWTVAGLLVIVLNLLATRDFKDPES